MSITSARCRQFLTVECCAVAPDCETCDMQTASIMPGRCKRKAVAFCHLERKQDWTQNAQIPNHILTWKAGTVAEEALGKRPLTSAGCSKCLTVECRSVAPECKTHDAAITYRRPDICSEKQWCKTFVII